MQFLKKTFKGLFGNLGRSDSTRSTPAARRAPSTSTAWSLTCEQSIQVGTGHSTGVVRSHNEDALFVLTGNAFGDDPLDGFGLFLVADGMGGHRAGEVASAVSVRTVARRLTEDTIIDLLAQEPQNDADSIQDILRLALQDANQAVVNKVPGGGTTLTAALVLDGQMVIGHVGDSRAYVIENDSMKAITRDHSLVERLRELGQLTEEEAAVHPQRNVLYRAIGQGANLEIDTLTHPVPKGGFLLLCSDGLWGEVSEDVIYRIISGSNHPQEACEALVRAANAAGGPDNITAVLVQFPKG
jgi:serine/threonine protein phosphatase PrpC